MNWDIVKGNWKDLKGKVREEWGDLTDDEVEQMKGDRDQMVGTVQKKYGWAKSDAERRVDDWASRHSLR